MNKIINFKILTMMLLINASMLCIITPPNPEINEEDKPTPIVTEGKLSPRRNLSCFFENAKEFDIAKINLFFRKDPVIYDLQESLRAEKPMPILASKKILLNILRRQLIVEDFRNLPESTLTDKYGKFSLFYTQNSFKSDSTVSVFKDYVTTLDQQEEARNAYLKNPNDTTFKDYSIANKHLKTNKGKLDESLFKDIGFFNKALDLVNKWAIGEPVKKFGTSTTILLIPKNTDGSLQETGWNLKNINILNSAPSSDDLIALLQKDDISNNRSKSQTDDLIDIAKPTSNNCAIAHITLIGHGRFNTDNSTPTPSIYADMEIEDAKTVVNNFDTSKVGTFAVHTCFGGGTNFNTVYNDDNGLLGVHSFTAIDGNSSDISKLTELPDDPIETNNFLIQFSADYFKKNNRYPSENEMTEIISNRNKYSHWYQNIGSNSYEAISNFFKNTIPGIDKFTSFTTIKLATTNIKQYATYLKDNILQISNITSRVKSDEGKSFKCNLKAGGGLLLSTNTILAPIIIEQGSKLPFIVPMNAEGSFYIKNIEIKDTTISIADFIEKSLIPFIDQINKVKKQLSTKEKSYTVFPETTIVIDSLKVKEGIITLVATRDYFCFIINGDTSDNGKPYKFYIPFEKEDPFALTLFVADTPEFKALADFEKIVEKGRKQKLNLELAGVEGKTLAQTIGDRQKALKYIQTLTGKADWQEFLQTHDVSKKNIVNNLPGKDAIFNTLIEAIRTEKRISTLRAFGFTPQDVEILSTLRSELLLNLSSYELTVLRLVIDSENDQQVYESNKGILQNTINIIDEEVVRRSLITNLNKKTTNGNNEFIDWYIGLSETRKGLIKYEFYAAIQNSKILDQDFNTLATSERAQLIDYFNMLKLISNDKKQIDDIDAKIQALTTPRDETVFNKYLQGYYNALINSSNKTAFIDWIAALNKTERQPINLDIIAFVAKEAFNDQSFQTCKLYTLNITELFTLKDILEQFFKSSSADQKSILEKASTLYKNKITMDDFATRVTPSLQILEDTMISLFNNNVTNKESVLLITPKSLDIYAQIFKTLSFTSQKKIIEDDLSILKESPDDVLKYQQSLIDERIKTAQTVEDFSKLKADIDAAKIPLTGTQKTLLAKDFFSAESAENKAIAQDIPFPNHGSTGTIVLYPEIIDETTGQATTPGAIIEHQADPSKPIDTPGTDVPNANPFEDEKTKEEYDQEATAEKARQDELKAHLDAMKKEQEDIDQYYRDML